MVQLEAMRQPVELLDQERVSLSELLVLPVLALQPVSELLLVDLALIEAGLFLNWLDPTELVRSQLSDPGQLAELQALNLFLRI